MQYFTLKSDNLFILKFEKVETLIVNRTAEFVELVLACLKDKNDMFGKIKKIKK